ncbi:hypothetical protein QAD02_006770 [Eretmocerus hayati]|uniref:Uncharacterized protein n=1 Tax=Eretmocerus hayati TaxID=131215 RepID=A0ACC2N1U5_9HYME|nr:hypothetical protein QAD02_006770 [Eretmocerus hayati]
MENKSIVKLPHHKQLKLCTTRPPYRQGRKLTAIKVYTVNDESQHLIIDGVPKIGLMSELKDRLSLYGVVKNIESIPDFAQEAFTESFHIHYEKIQNARVAKHLLDGFNFFGGVLHVAYAPELENQFETKGKLLKRKNRVSSLIKEYKRE